MYMRENRFVYTSEAVSEGHPDKMCDQISDAVLDAALAEDPKAHVACETLATTQLVVLAGEIKSAGSALPYEDIVRRVVKRIGYERPGEGFDAKTLKVLVNLHAQSADIDRGVEASTSLSGEQGAGDQGIMFGYACDETPEYMPAPYYYAQLLVRRLAELRHGDPVKYGFLRPDAKSQLSFAYENGRPVSLVQIVVSHQHAEGMNPEVHDLVKRVIRENIPAQYLTAIDFESENGPGASLHINPTGNFVTGGPDGDCGLTGRKIIVDTYGGMGRHGGGAFSGKDPSKVDRSASYMARHVAKNLVAAGLARRCELQVSYAIGIARPLSFYVNFFGTGNVPEEKVEAMLHRGRPFDFRPAAITEYLGLLKPQGWSYEETAAYGHFGRPQFPWEKTLPAEKIHAALEE